MERLCSAGFSLAGHVCLTLQLPNLIWWCRLCLEWIGHAGKNPFVNKCCCLQVMTIVCTDVLWTAIVEFVFVRFATKTFSMMEDGRVTFMTPCGFTCKKRRASRAKSETGSLDCWMVAFFLHCASDNRKFFGRIYFNCVTYYFRLRYTSRHMLETSNWCT